MKIGNWPLFLLALEHIIKHGDLYDQTMWRNDCGSRRCLAGWIAYFAGYRDVVEGPAKRFVGVRLEGLTEFEDIMDVEDAALTALELDSEIYGTVDDLGGEYAYTLNDLSDDLFNGGRTMTDILGFVRDLARADGVTPTPIIVNEMLDRGVITRWDVL